MRRARWMTVAITLAVMLAAPACERRADPAGPVEPAAVVSGAAVGSPPAGRPQIWEPVDPSFKGCEGG